VIGRQGVWKGRNKDEWKLVKEEREKIILGKRAMF
jgi:hypothetical protein